jgi:hypothetical protein
VDRTGEDESGLRFNNAWASPEVSARITPNAERISTVSDDIEGLIPEPPLQDEP